MALENGHPGLAQLLLDHGADPNTRYINGLTLLHVSSQLGDLKVVQELLLKRVSINRVKFPIDRIPIMDILSIGNFTGVFHTSVQRTLDELPESLETYEHILKEIKNPNRDYVCHLFSCSVVAVRLLLVKELADVLAFNFGSGWRTGCGAAAR